jgi:hypothetical protein
MRVLLAILSTVLLAAPLWVALAYWSTGPLGAIYGWSGHPPLPGAPDWVYWTLFAVALPVLCLGVAGAVVHLVTRWLCRRRGARQRGGERPPVDTRAEEPRA